jgi:hypothetical protein
MSGQFSNLDEFWPFYLAQHLNRANRRLHFAGTTSALILIPAALFLRKPALLAAAAVVAYGFAWIGHFFFEHNRPATFQYPLLSLKGDFRMYWMTWTGGLDDEIKKRTADIRSHRARSGESS